MKMGTAAFNAGGDALWVQDQPPETTLLANQGSQPHALTGMVQPFVLYLVQHRNPLNLGAIGQLQ